MAKYIKAADLDREIRGLCWAQTYKYPMLMMIKEANGIELVQCKDCAKCRCHANDSVAETAEDKYWCDYWDAEVLPDEFCKYGEEKGENE